MAALPTRQDLIGDLERTAGLLAAMADPAWQTRHEVKWSIKEQLDWLETAANLRYMARALKAKQLEDAGRGVGSPS
jgi:hypothetical protein